MKKSRLWHIIFCLYGLLMLYLMFIRSRGWINGVPYWTQVEGNFNPVPFHTIGNYWHVLTNREYYLQKWEAAAIYNYQARHAVINLFGNVIMFIPLGFLLPKVFPKLRRFWKVMLVTAGIIILVELAQLFTLMGSCDVDDLILNVPGAALGYGIYKLFDNK